MAELDVQVGAAIAQLLIRGAEAAIQESAQPVVAPLHVVASVAEVVCVPRIDVRAAAPVDPRLQVLIVVEIEVIPEILDGATVERSVSHDVGHTDTRVQHAASASRADVLKVERQPEHRHIVDVENAGPSHGKLPLHQLQLARTEMVVRNGVVAGCDGAAATEECGFDAKAVICEAGALRVDEIFLPTLDRGLHVADGPATLGGVVVHRAARNHIVSAARRIVQDVLDSECAHHLARVVVDDRVADHDRLITTDGGPRAVVADQRQEFVCGVKGDGAALKSRDAVPLLQQQRVDDGVRFRPRHELFF